MVRRKKSANVQIKIRAKEELRARLEKTAKNRNVSMNTEIVDRLERSFEFGSIRNERIAMLVAHTMEAIEARTKKSVTDDRDSWAAVQMALAGFFGLPYGERGVKAEVRRLGQDITRNLLVRLGQSDSEVDKWLRQMAVEEVEK